MKKNINLKELTITISLLLSLFGILFLKWAIDRTFVIAIIPLCVIFCTIFSTNSIKFNKSILLLLLILSFIILFNFFIPIDRKYLVDALLKGTIVPLFVGGYFLILKQKVTEKDNKLMNLLFWVLNLYLILNFFIMLKQISTPGFMVHNRSGNTFYIDMINGLIGENGSHKLSYLYIAVLYLNLSFVNNRKKVYSFSSKIFFLFLLISSLYISAFNDNRAYYFLIIFSFLPIIISKIKNLELSKSQIIKSFILIFFSIFIVFFAYNFNSNIKSFIDENIIDNYILRSVEKFNQSAGKKQGRGEERIELLKYSIKNTNLLYGRGIGSIDMTRDLSVPLHFGINDINIRIYTGGIPFSLIIILIYALFFYYLFDDKNLIFLLFCVVYSLFSSFYTQAYSQIDKTFLIFFAMYMICFVVNKSKLKKE